MTFSFLLFITRKPTLTPAEFKAHWDTKHIELVKSIAGDSFPLTHTRKYISRTEADGTWPAEVLVGSQADFSYDGVAHLVFTDKPAFERFLGIVSAPEAAARIAKDEEVFIVREKMRAVVLGDVSITTRN